MLFRSCWPIYGCSKPNCEPYKLTHIYDNNFKNVKFKHNILNIMKDCSVFYNKVYEAKYIDKKTEKEINSKVNLSNNKIVKETIENAKNPNMINNKLIKYILKKKKKTNYSEIEITYAKSLLECLNKEYYDDYEKWFKIGITLHNISSNSSESWHKFSKKSKK